MYRVVPDWAVDMDNFFPGSIPYF